jgi:hypothetical protein
MGNQGSSINVATYIIPGQKNIQPKNSSNATNVDRQQQQQVTPKSRTEQPKQPVQQYKYNVTLKGLKEVFKYFAGQSDYLTKSQFNDCIQRIFNFPDIPFMHHTHLSEKIYYLLDDSGDGKIQEQEFVDGFRNVILNVDYRHKCKNKIHI